MLRRHKVYSSFVCMPYLNIVQSKPHFAVYFKQRIHLIGPCACCRHAETNIIAISPQNQASFCPRCCQMSMGGLVEGEGLGCNT